MGEEITGKRCRCWISCWNFLPTTTTGYEASITTAADALPCQRNPSFHSQPWGCRGAGAVTPGIRTAGAAARPDKFP